MFTGIVQEIGRITSLEKDAEGGMNLVIACFLPFSAISEGASVCCQGICLTVENSGREAESDTDDEGEEKRHHWFRVSLSPHTVKSTSAGRWAVGDTLNLETSLTLRSLLGGHLLTGHVDETAIVRKITAESLSYRVEFSLPASLVPLVAKRGSVAVDGVSLTVADISAENAKDHWFSVVLIPHSWKVTTLHQLKEGSMVNLEADMMARYASRLIEVYKGSHS
ncbi:MAG: riboflavin synthase [Alphaproteobacteria bacterium]